MIEVGNAYKPGQIIWTDLLMFWENNQQELYQMQGIGENQRSGISYKFFKQNLVNGSNFG